MTYEGLDKRLRSLNEREMTLQNLLKNKSDIAYKKQLKEFFSDNQDHKDWIINYDKVMSYNLPMTIHKHDRFIPFDYHKHDYLELIFVYSGKIRQAIEQEEMTIKKGEIVILDMNVEHRIDVAGMDDIAINVLLTQDFFDWIFLKQIAYNNVISDFVVKALYEKKAYKQNLHFKTSHNEKIWQLMLSILYEYYEPKIGMETAIKSYMTLLFNELLRDYRMHLNDHVANKVEKTMAIEIMDYIHDHSSNGSLKEMAASFNFHPDYMGKLIKQVTGKTYKVLMKDRKIQQAKYLLEHTQLSIVDIVSEVGYSNVSYFYKQFKESMGITPDTYRHQSKHFNKDIP
ncbi:helix-turn-helix transcriptional regulator [Vallitalea pronyensis]|uniref:Helix-turn-helix transcriptional regulator n=1 Tax=Vallitalea pronyensis TaxID=1348613 RepID=A0A8J8MG38_9FIRM|nr:AraC family transcriptional regulator [Vallitalea pronyensis]QUI20949.1 helix-turn-helix transcriptional regulator [Vallitalea pronyensis]